MESSAFPDKIYKIKNLQIDEGFYVFQNYAKCALCNVCLFTLNIRKMPISILIATRKEIHQWQKGQRKNIAQAIYY